MSETKHPITDMEKRLDCLASYLSDRGHPVPLPILKEAIACYEGAVDRVPKQTWPTLTKAERDALEQVFSSWDTKKSFLEIVAEMFRSAHVPITYAPNPAYSGASGTRLGHVLVELEKDYPQQRGVEFKALETCLIRWGALSYDEVLQTLDSADEARIAQHLVVWESQEEMTPAELAAKIRSEYNFFRMNMPGHR